MNRGVLGALSGIGSAVSTVAGSKIEEQRAMRLEKLRRETNKMNNDQRLANEKSLMEAKNTNQLGLIEREYGLRSGEAALNRAHETKMAGMGGGKPAKGDVHKTEDGELLERLPDGSWRRVNDVLSAQDQRALIEQREREWAKAEKDLVEEGLEPGKYKEAFLKTGDGSIVDKMVMEDLKAVEKAKKQKNSKPSDISLGDIPYEVGKGVKGFNDYLNTYPLGRFVMDAGTGASNLVKGAGGLLLQAKKGYQEAQ